MGATDLRFGRSVSCSTDHFVLLSLNFLSGREDLSEINPQMSQINKDRKTGWKSCLPCILYLRASALSADDSLLVAAIGCAVFDRALDETVWGRRVSLCERFSDFFLPSGMNFGTFPLLCPN